MMDSMVGHRCGVNCVVDRGSGKRAAGKCCEGNLGISLGLGGSQDSGEEGSNGKCLHDVALLEDRGGSMVHSVVCNRCGVNCVVDRGSGKRAAGKCCEGNLGISLG